MRKEKRKGDKPSVILHFTQNQCRNSLNASKVLLTFLLISDFISSSTLLLILSQCHWPPVIPQTYQTCSHLLLLCLGQSPADGHLAGPSFPPVPAKTSPQEKCLSQLPSRKRQSPLPSALLLLNFIQNSTPIGMLSMYSSVHFFFFPPVEW